ncbi:MAG: hypothetical protein IJS97_01060 [Prevotella sp.]|nr:hypothetical protein [Prevotella sp.]
MKKILRFLMLTLLILVGGNVVAHAETVTWVAAEQGYANGESVSSVTIDDNISMVLGEGTSAPFYYTTGTAVRVYAGGTLSLNGGEGITITKVVFTFGSGDKTNEITTEVGTYANGTWTGKSPNVVFTIGGTSGHRRFASVEVTYDVAVQETNEATWLGAESNALPTEIGNDIALTWLEASGDQPPFFNSTKMVASLKKNNKLTIAGADANVTITGIVFTFDNSSDPGLGASVGSTSSSYAENTTTWTGNANSITFTASSARLIKSIKVTYTGSATPVVKAPVLTITSDGLADTYDMDANGVFVVRYENTGNAVAENAKLTLFVDGVENASKEIGTLNFGSNDLNFWNAKYNLEGLEAGEHQVYLSMTADNAEAFNTEAKTVTFTKKAAEATFSISATAVTVAHDATSYDVVATLQETNGVAATDVKVELRKGISDVLATQTVATLDANGETQVTLTVAKELFGTGENTYNLYVNDKFLANVTVTFEEAPVVETKDLAITEVLGTIKLAEETNYVRVTVQNNGTVDITDAPVVLKAGETTLGEGTVSATAGNTGYVQISVNKEGLTAGELNVTATVTVEGDVTPADNVMEATLNVEAIPVPEAAYAVTAENVTVAYGAESFDIVAVVKNTSEVAAENVEVKLMKGIEVIDTKSIDALAAGAETNVTFTIAATEENPFEAGKNATYFVQVANKAQAEVTVTFEDAPVAPVVDIALIDIRGLENINLSAESNVVMVTFQNNSNVDVENATITLTMNGTQVGEPQTIAKGDYSKSFTLPTEGLVAGETAELVATLSVEGNKEGNTVEVTKTLAIVSGEVEPAPVITMNPISSWEVEEVGEQTINVSVGVFNTGDADAEEVTVKVYHTYGTDLDSKTVAIEKGESALVSLSFDYDIQGTTEFHVVAYINNVPVTEAENFTVSVKQVVADLSLAKIADINATTEEEVKIAAVVKNTSAIDATEVKVGVYTQDENYQYQLVGIQQTIETVAAGAEESVEFNLGKLAAGNYKYYVRIVNTDDNMENNMQDVTVKVTEPVAPVVNVNLTAIQGLSNIDLAADENAITVWIANEGNVNVEGASVAVKLNETELTAQTVDVQAGKNAYVSFVLPTEGLVAGTTATVVATVTIEGNTSETTTLTREYDVVDSSVATEPVFAVEAQAVEVELGAEKFNVVATVKNTSTIAAENFDVTLFYNEVIATKTVESLAAGAETTVTFEDVVNPFTKAGSYTMYVQAPKAQGEVAVTVKEPYVAPVYDMAITMIQGSLDLAYENGNVSVAVENKGNQDMTDAAVKLTVGETAYDKTVSVKAGETGYAIFTVATEGLTAGELSVTATVTVEGDATPEDNTKTETITVKTVDPAQPTYEVAAENVTVAYGAESFNIVAVVKNTSEVAAENVEVKLMKGIADVETKNIATLAAGAEETVTFTIAATEENPFEAGKTATYFVQVANAVQTEVTVTFEEAPVTPVVDLAVTSITGTLSVEVENSYLTVFVENLGNVDMIDAQVTLKAGEVELGTATVSAKAGNNGFCSIAVPAEKLTDETIEVTATVVAEGDIDETNNTLTKTFEVAMPAAQVSISVEDVTVDAGTTSFVVPVKVKNLREDYAAKNVKVMIYDSAKLIGQATVETLAAGAEETVNVNIELETAYAATTKLRAWVTGYSETQLVEFNLIISGTNGIEAIKAAFGKNVQIYTLNGVKVNNVVKGQVYIVNGRKVVMK